MDPDLKLIHLLDDLSFTRWINGRANQKEECKWEKWEKESPLHTDLKRKARKLYGLPLEEFDELDASKQLSRLYKRIDEYEKAFNSSLPSKQINRGYRIAVAAAVAFLIAVVGTLAVYHKQFEENSSQPLYSTIEVGYGERGLLKISDGSTVRLNANSSLRYSAEQFNASTMEVWLEGEAYFSITRNPDEKKRSFIVHTSDGEVRVLGTRFNVNTRFRRTGVVLEEGTIEVVQKDSLHGIAGQRVLKPGQRAVMVSGRKSNVEVQQVDTLLYTAWLDGKLIFDGTPLAEVIQSIEETYGISMKAEEPELLRKKISGTFKNPDIKTLIEGLEEVFDLKIQQKTEKTYLIFKRHRSQ